MSSDESGRPWDGRPAGQGAVISAVEAVAAAGFTPCAMGTQ